MQIERLLLYLVQPVGHTEKQQGFSLLYEPDENKKNINTFFLQ